MPKTEEYIEVNPDFTGEPIVHEDVTPEPVQTQPVTPPPIITEPDIEAIKAQARRDALAEYEASNRVTTAPQQTNDLPVEFYDNPTEWIERKVQEKTQTAIQASWQLMAPYVQRNMADDVVRKIGSDLTPGAQEYARNLAAKLSPGQPLEGDALDLIKNATLFKDREEREKMARRPIEPVAAEPQNVRIDRQAFDECNNDRKKLGAKPLTAKEFAELMGA